MGKREIHDKLVRDRIPEIIRGQGGEPVTRVLDREEYLERLDQKLREELEEYLESGELEELADLCEAMRAAVEARGWSWDELEAVRKEKAARCGAFAQRLLLERVARP